MSSFAEALKKDLAGIDRMAFVAAQAKTKRRPKRKPAEREKRVLQSRDKRMRILDSANRHRRIVIKYRKITTGEVKKYEVEPYSYRYRMLRSGMKKLLFAHDVVNDHHIKGFVMRNILDVRVTDKRFRPRWQMEIALTEDRDVTL